MAQTVQPLRSLVWHFDVQRNAICPVCSKEGALPVMFEIDSIIEPYPRLAFAKCPDCETIFQLDFKPPEYDTDDLLPAVPVSLKFHVEQGAALDIIALPAMLASKRPMRSYLEVGCGFGFGVDFARHAFGWDASGIDPSPLAQEGAKLLSIKIENRYLTEMDAQSGISYDAIAAVEVVEHMQLPYDFIKILKSNLSPDGLLTLTTPNAAYVEFGRDKPFLLGILTPGYHAIIYTERSLALMLRNAGFTHVKTAIRGECLVAVAGDGAVDVELGSIFDAKLHADYLEKRMRSFQRQSRLERIILSTPLRRRKFDFIESRRMLQIGFGYRLFKALVNAAQYAKAADLLDSLTTAIKERDSIDLRNPDSVVGKISSRTRTHQEFVKAFPACIVGLLYYQGILRLNAYEDRSGALASFYAAHFIAGIFRAAMNKFNIDDGETAHLELLALRHINLVSGWMSGGS